MRSPFRRAVGSSDIYNNGIKKAMSKDDIRAAAEYCRNHPAELSIGQVLSRWSRQVANKPLREFATEVLQNAELEAKLSMVAPWYDGTSRSEQRLAAMLARKHGVSWWRDLKQTGERLGVIDDAWHAERVEPLLETINEADPQPAGIPHDQRTKPMTKAEALNYIGWPAGARSEREAREWLTRSIRDGEYRWEQINNKSGVYHLDDFNPQCWEEIRAH